MMTKECRICGNIKPRQEYYRRKKSSDGLYTQCKACMKSEATRSRNERLEQVREYDRKRAKLPHRAEHIRATVKAWGEKYPERIIAQRKANQAHRSGALIAPHLCEDCGSASRLEKHHTDYSQPLMVAWLCKPCHAVADKKRDDRNQQEGQEAQ